MKWYVVWKNASEQMRMIYNGEIIKLQDKITYDDGSFWYNSVAQMEINEITDDHHASDIACVLMNMAGVQ